MPEILLNLLWVVVSTAVLVRLLTCNRCARDNGYVKSFAALACISVLLFPVLSATDDLCTTQLAAEDSTVVKKLAEYPPSLTIQQHHTFAVQGISHFTVEPGWTVAGLVPTFTAVRDISLSRSSLVVRPPPIA